MLVEYITSRPGQVDAAIKECPLALVPVGSLEWHGPHMPLGFDGLKAEHLLKRVGTALGRGVIFPTIYFGAYDVMAFPHTYAFKRKHLQDQLAAFTGQLVASGYRVVVMLTGHYPGSQVRFLEKLAIETMKRHPDVSMLAVPEYYLLTRSKQGGDHAAKLETSLGLSMFPQWVDMEQLPATDGSREALRPLGIGGEDPKAHATREKGDAWAQEVVDAIITGTERSLSEQSQAAFLEIYASFHRLALTR
ncbi:MAG: creatininase family protein [Candidatus Lokiarchaeota archaeon]|nr:creatininase family protein [Candidatus Lokiarchaeota archaeon]